MGSKVDGGHLFFVCFSEMNAANYSDPTHGCLLGLKVFPLVRGSSSYTLGVAY